MNHSKQNLNEFLDQSFARFRELPSNGVESACDHVLDRLRKETDRTPEAIDLRPRASRRHVRLVVLIAATAAVAVFAHQLASRRPTPARVVKEVVVAGRRAPEPVALVQQPTPEAPKPAPPAARPRLEFAAASIKALAPGTRMPGVGLACHGTDGVQRVVLWVEPNRQDAVKAPLGRCVGSGIFLSTLIEMAYGVSPRQLSGGPDWSRTAGFRVALGGGAGMASLPISLTLGQDPAWDKNESFQIEATADSPSTATLEQLRQMLQTTLADRFKLRFHHERKEVPGYSLVVAERGSKLKPISGDYVESLLLYQGKSTMGQFANSLGSFLLGGTPVIDKTGLKGAYEYQFEPLSAVWGAHGVGGGPAQSPAETAENVSAALEQQLGLRLQPERAVSVEALVIDSVEPPSPN